MTNRIKFIILPLLFAAAFYACKPKEKYEDVTYYKTIGIGYVFMYDDKDSLLYPIQGAKITITTRLDRPYSGFLSPPQPKETFITDVNGKYQVRFIKRTQLRDAIEYFIEMEPYTGYGIRGNDFVISVDEVKNAKHITLDTIKAYKSIINY